MSTGSPSTDTPRLDDLLSDVAGALRVEELEEHTGRLARQITEALAPAAAAVGLELATGPADAQDGVEDLLPPGRISGLIARLRDTPAVQVVLILGEAFPTAAPAVAGDADPELPEPWMAPVAGTMERWAAELGATLVNAMPVGDATQLGHLLIDAPGTMLMAAGIFGGTKLAGAVAVVGRTELAPAPTEAAPRFEPPTATEDPHVAAATGGAAPSGGPGTAGGRQSAPAGRPSSAALEAMHVLAEVEMKVTAELGRTRMSVSDLLSLAPGSLIELDRTAGSPIDLLVNGTLIARGEVVVVDEEYGIRLTEITGSES